MTRRRFTIFHKLTFFVFIGCYCLQPAQLRSALDNVNVPPLTVIIIVDQFAYDYIPKLMPHLKYGFKELFRNGICYENAYFSHGIPETTTGHNCIITGTQAKDNGGITNQWVDKEGKKVHYEYDTDPKSIPFGASSQDGGRSEKNTLVDCLSDQFLLYSTATYPSQVWALALKSYPAIITAGKMGLALWFDEKKGVFTSTPRYFSSLPEWVEKFNEKLKKTHDKIVWKPFYPRDSKAYAFPFINDYEFTSEKSYIDASPLTINPSEDKPYTLFIRTPTASKTLFALAKTCLDAQLPRQTKTATLLILSLSNLDLCGHLFGPDCFETIDTIYHIDKQLKNFMDSVKRKVGAKNVLFVLTADHGVCPIPELQRKKGFKHAARIQAKSLITTMNTDIEKEFGISNIVKNYEPSSFRLNYTIFESLDAKTKTAIMNHLVTYLKKQPGIKNAWTYDELANTHFEADQIERHYQNQLFPGRMGDIICQPDYYCSLTNYPSGTAHDTPYDYNLHVPLVFYQKGVLQPKKITQKVYLTQLAVTLAQLLHISKPSATPHECLPEITIEPRS